MKSIKMNFRRLFSCIFIAFLVYANFIVAPNFTSGKISLKGIMKNASAQEGPIDPGQVGTTERCKEDIGGGYFRSSIEYVCWDCYVCPSCTCTPEPRGG